MTDEEEGRLLDRVLEGDEDAFRTLYRLHTPSLWHLALRLTGGREADAEDVLQESWSRCITGLSRFQRRSSLRTWLTVIAARCASERYRRENREAADTGSGAAVDRAQGDPAGRIDLERAFAALPFGFRSVLVLHDVEGFRHREIAEMLGISPGTSKSQLSRARRRMRSVLGEDYARP